MFEKNKVLIDQIEKENAFINNQISKITGSKKQLEIKDMADLHRYSETRLFNLRSLSILNGSEEVGY